MRQRLVLSATARLAPFRRTIGTTGGLVLATALNNGTGFVFWWIAAREFPEAAVGLAGAAVSAMLLLSQLSVLGLGTTLAGVLHREPRPASLAIPAIIAAGVTGIATGSVFALVVPLIATELGPIRASVLTVATFSVGVALTAVSSLVDQSLVSLFRGSYQLLRNTIFSFSRLLLLIGAAVLLTPEGMVVYGAWLLGTLVSFVALVGLRPHISGLGPLQWRRLGGMAFGALSHHVLNLSRSATVWLLPVLVVTILSREANAAFYAALLLANFISVVGTSATFTLYVVGARAPDQLWRQIRFTLGLTLLAAIGGTVIMAVAGAQLLAFFNPGYVSAYPTIVVLALATMPLVIKDHWIAIQRVHGGVGRAARIGIGTLAVELTASAVGLAMGGLIGLALARLAVLIGQAVVMAPAVIRAMSRSPAGHRPAAPMPVPDVEDVAL